VFIETSKDKETGEVVKPALNNDGQVAKVKAKKFG
jgi:hypothetical protein